MSDVKAKQRWDLDEDEKKQKTDEFTDKERIRMDEEGAREMKKKRLTVRVRI